MKTILKTRKLWDFIENRDTLSSSSENTPALTRERDDQVMKDMMAMQILKQQFPMLFFQGSCQVKMINLQFLRREYENLKMSESDIINTFSTKLIDMGNQLRIHGEEKSDYQIVQKILISLPERFVSILAVLEQTKDLTVISVIELIGTLKAHEKC